MLQNIFTDVLIVSLTTAAVIAALAMLSPLIHKSYTAKWQYFVWLILAVRLLIPFSLSLPQAPIKITPPFQNSTFIASGKNTADSPTANQSAGHETAKASAALPEAAAARAIEPEEIPAIVWVSGIALFMLYQLIGYCLFRKSAVRYSRPIAGKRLAELWQETKEEMKISRNIRLLVAKKAQSPMMTGFFRPLLLLPDLDYSDMELKLILRHELIHYKRKDIWLKLLLVCANAVHWFNPLVYLMTNMFNKDIEMACDSEVVRDSDAAFRKQYSESVLNAVHKGNLRRMALSTYFYGGKTALKERFANINDMRKKRRGIAAICAIITAVFVFGAAVAYGGTSSWKSVDTGLFKLSIPNSCEAKASDSGEVGIIQIPSGEELGHIEILGDFPITELIGNHAEILKSESLEGCKYPATKVIVRRTKPAAANDSSYADETHFYLHPENNNYIVDLSFVSSLAEHDADEMARRIIIDTDLVQMRVRAEQWARAVGYRDGKAQYDLMSEQLKNTVYDDFQRKSWETGPSNLWLNSFTALHGDSTAAISYTYIPANGIEGFYLQKLTFSKENGQLLISAFTEPQKVDSLGSGTVIACTDDGSAWLSAANLNGAMFSDMTLSVSGKTKSFPWKAYGESAFLPKLSYADIDGDGRSELIVTLCEGEGTGTSLWEIHVFNPEDLSEIAVQSPMDAIKSRVATSVDENGAKLTIDNQKTVEFTAEALISKAGEKDHWFSNLAAGSIIKYTVEGGRITAEVGEQITPASFLGFLYLTYEYKDNQLKVSGIRFLST